MPEQPADSQRTSPDTDTALVRCGRCGEPFAAPPAAQGHVQSCPKCAATIRIPADIPSGIVATALELSDVDRVITFGCDRCDSMLEASMSVSGQIGRCPTCGARFRIPRHDAVRDDLIGYELLDANDQNPVPMHAYAANGEQAPAIVPAAVHGELQIECRRCGARSPMEADLCPACGVPFTIEGAPAAPPRGPQNARAMAALLLAVLSLPLSFLLIPSLLAMMLALSGMDNRARRGASLVALSALCIAAVSLLVGLAIDLGTRGC